MGSFQRRRRVGTWSMANHQCRSECNGQVLEVTHRKCIHLLSPRSKLKRHPNYQTHNRTKPWFKNKKAFYKCIDTLPWGTKWTCEPFEIVGDEKDEKGHFQHEILHLWKQNPVKCIHELIGNPAFWEHMQYIPEKVYEDEDGTMRIFDQMWMGDWWNLQVSPSYLERRKCRLTQEF